MLLFVVAVEGGGGEHAHPHHAGIGDLEPDLRRADRGIENRADVADSPGKNAVRISIQLDVRVLAQAHVFQIVLIDIADDPDVRQIGNRKRVGGREALHARCRRHLLIGDHSGNGRKNIDDRGRMIFVGAQHPQVFFRGFHCHFGFLFRIDGHFIVLLRHRAGFEKHFRAGKLGAGQYFVRHRLPVIRERARDVRALHAHQKLAFGDGVAELRAHFDHAAGCQRDHGNIPRNIRIDNAGDVQLRRRVVGSRRCQRELFRMIDLDQAGIAHLLDLRRRRRFRLRIGFGIGFD